jgi:hypothetical protein
MAPLKAACLDQAGPDEKEPPWFCEIPKKRYPGRKLCNAGIGAYPKQGFITLSFKEYPHHDIENKCRKKGHCHTVGKKYLGKKSCSSGKITAAAHSKYDAAQNKKQERGTEIPGSGHGLKKNPGMGQEMGHNPEKAHKHMFRIQVILKVLFAIF